MGHMGINALTSADVAAGQQTLLFSGTSEFSIPLPCGFFLGNNPIPLSASFGVKGVNIQINLSPDSNIFFATDNGIAASSAYYMPRNPQNHMKRVGRALQPRPCGGRLATRAIVQLVHRNGRLRLRSRGKGRYAT